MADPWRHSAQGIGVALRVTPRGGRDAVDGVETLANGRTLVKVRVRAIAEGGEANRAVTELLTSTADPKSLHRKRRVRSRDFGSISGTRTIDLLAPMTFRSSPKGVAEADCELRKVGASRARRPQSEGADSDRDDVAPQAGRHRRRSDETGRGFARGCFGETVMRSI
jgi:Uncharacterised ACR, YggU family COG1872